MLMAYGNTKCGPEWKVEEKIAPGYFRMYYVYGGEVTYQDDQGSRMLRPGNLYLFPSAAPYQMLQNAANPLDCTFLHLDLLPSVATNLIEISVERNSVLVPLLSAVAASIEAGEAKLVVALAEAFEIYCRENDLVPTPVGPVSRSLVYISENVSKHISVADLCGRAGYNGQYFIRLFKQAIGMTPHQYIVNARLKEAKKLLKTSLTISQIAEATGYGDIKSFSRSFKSNFGLTPTDYRKVYTVQP